MPKDNSKKMKRIIRHWIPTLMLGLTLFLLLTNCSKDDDVTKNALIPAVITKEVIGITLATAISGGVITSDGGATVIEKGVCWSTNPAPTIADNMSSTSIGEENYYSGISGLSSNTIYFVRAFATNRIGTGYGNAISFTTKQIIIDGSFTDQRDGTIYKTIAIGSQVWMAENLRYLPSVSGPGIGSITIPYYYVYGYDGTNVDSAKAISNFTTNGVLYNWPAAMAGAASSSTNQSGVQGVCPTGWHLPSDEEWTQLTDYLGGGHVAGGKLKEVGTIQWNSPNTGATNTTGFSAFPGGYRSLDNNFDHLGSFGYWYSATEYDAVSAWYRSMSYNYSGIGGAGFSKALGFSVRCVRN
jgi:uncharacterized protein (TIGR02145 family)